MDSLSPLKTAPKSPRLPVRSLERSALSREAARILKSVFLRAVIPLLLDSRRLPATEAEALRKSARALELAELLVATDDAASLTLIRELRGDDADAKHLFVPLFEMAARSLGDMWADDVVTEFAVTLGLCRLQSVVRLLGTDAKRAVPSGEQPKVLIAPVPGELHQLVAALNSEWLLSQGWTPTSEFPADDRARTDLLSTTWVDILDLSLSAAFRREESLPRLTKTIVLARRASLNRHVVVAVGGRAFVEDETVAYDVGADLVSRTSTNADRGYAMNGQDSTVRGKVREGRHAATAVDFGLSAALVPGGA